MTEAWIHLGRGESGRLAEELQRRQARRLFLVTGKASYRACGAEQALAPLLSPYAVRSFDDFAPNPEFADAAAGALQCRQHRPDVIIGVGGGSVLDMAKLINAFQAHPDHERELALGRRAVTNPLLPLVAIPTTAGTGSEATHFAVVYSDGRKHSLAASELLPEVAIVDAAFTDHMSPYLTACCGFDALCQAVESYWSLGADAESMAVAVTAIEALVRWLEASVKQGSQPARDGVMRGAHLAGRAINRSKTTAPHALSYALTKDYGIPHGHACAITLGQFFEIHQQTSATDSQPWLGPRMRDLYRLLGVADAEQARQWWYGLMQTCGLETRLSRLGIGREEGAVERIVAGVNLERLGNHPIALSPEILEQVLARVL